jgi:hypothetical protein
LQICFYTITFAVCTHIHRKLCLWHSRLWAIADAAAARLIHGVVRKIALKVFELSCVFFELSVALHQRRVIAHERQGRLLNREDAISETRSTSAIL